MNPDEKTLWEKVEIKANVPNKMPTFLHHRHDEDFACSACYIQNLLNEIKELKKGKVDGK